MRRDSSEKAVLRAALRVVLHHSRNAIVLYDQRLSILKASKVSEVANITHIFERVFQSLTKRWANNGLGFFPNRATRYVISLTILFNIVT